MLEYNNILSLGATLLIGLGFGILLQKGRFCFTSALRDFIAFKDTRVLNGVIIGIVTMMLGTSIAYVLGVSSSNFWVSNYGLSNIIGGFIFGIGMVYGGGCASGTLYRAGEGYIHYWLLLISACVGYIAFAALFPEVFLPYFFVPLQIFDGYSLIASLELLAPVVPIVLIATSIIYLRNKNKLIINQTIQSIKISNISSESLKAEWDTKLVGLGMGILATLWFVVWGTLSITGPQAKWTGLIYSEIVGLETLQQNVYWNNVVFRDGIFSISLDMILFVSLILGAFISAYLSGDFKVRVIKRSRIPNAVIGGLVMGFGSRMAPGCNISNTFSGLAFLSVAGFITSLGLLLGVYVATHWMFRRSGCAI